MANKLSDANLIRLKQLVNEEGISKVVKQIYF